MTEEQVEFERKWWYKIVVPRLNGAFADFPIKHYVITAALYENDERGTILALYALDYSEENKHWFTLRIPKKEIEWAMFGLELIDTPEATVLAEAIRERHRKEIEKIKDEKNE